MEGSPRTLVLIVDDDARSATLLAKMLLGDGYDTEVATDGSLAIARLSRDPVPDVLVTDMHLHYADGASVARYARSRRTRMPVFVVTGYPQSFAKEHRTFDHPVTLITKPLDYGDLVRRLALAMIAARGV